MNVLLYRVGRNLNRVYRTCEAFGVYHLWLLECSQAYLSGNLFAAKDRVQMKYVTTWQESKTALALETWGDISLSEFERWNEIATIVLGSETDGLPRAVPAQYVARIPQVGKVSGLTVEAALAIALYEWRRHESV